MKNRGIAVALALILGWIGIHRFYVGQIGWGILFLLFCWTYIPLIVGIINGIRYWYIGEEEFQKRYSTNYAAAA